MLWPTDILSIESWILIGTVLLLVRYYIKRKWSVLKSLNIPHDPPSILNLGHARSVLSDKVFWYDLECKKKYGPVWGHYILLSPRIVFHDPGMLQQVCIKEFSTFPNRTTRFRHLNGDELGNCLLEIRDDQWRRVRKTMTPTFSSSKLKQMVGIVDWCVDNTISVFRNKIETEDGRFIVKDVFARLSLDVICSSAFSTNVNSQDEAQEEPKISINAKKFHERGSFGVLALLFSILPSFIGRRISNYNGKREQIVFFNMICRQIMEQRGDESKDVQNRIDLLQLMLDSRVPEAELKNGARKGMSEIEIIGNSMVMILAGYETTSTVMSFLAYNLAQHQEVQRQLQAEIDDMMKTKEKLDYESVNNLKFLDMCVNESIRLYSPVAKTVRHCDSEIILSGVTIPRNTAVVIPIYALSHDPEYWEAPMEFKPERMKNMDEIDPMVFQPFGSGPRNCIGMRFALMEVKVAFCKLLHEFTFEPTVDTPKPPLELKFSLTTRPKVNFGLRVLPRTNHVE